MKFTTAQIAYHWVSFGLILLMAATGMAYFYEIGGKAPMVVHQIAGQLLIGVLAVRLVTRLIRRPSETQSSHAAWERGLATLTHVALYLTMIAFVASGYVSASALSDPTLIAPVNKAFARSDFGERILEVHYTLKWVLLALVGLHAAGALKHHFWDKDDTLTNMTFKARKG